MNNKMLLSVFLMSIIFLYSPLSYSDSNTEALQKYLLQSQAEGEDAEDQEAAEEDEYYEEAEDEDMDDEYSESEDEMDQEEDSEETDIEEE